MRRYWIAERCFRAFLMTLGGLLMIAGVCRATENMTVEELKALLGRPDVFVIDLRTTGEWNDSFFKVPHAVHEDPTEVRSWAAKYSKDAVMVLYCS